MPFSAFYDRGYDHTAADGEVEDQNPLSDFGKKYRVKTDITNFYHSVYSHSLPWALVGHSHAKRHKGPKHKDEWFNKIDYSVTLCQRNETKGISIGPATSTILSEIILFQVDKVLRDEKGYQFTRYIDDYTAYVESNGKADQFLSDLTQELEKFIVHKDHQHIDTHEGFYFLCRGASLAFRNPAAHALIELSEQEAEVQIAMMAYLIDHIDRQTIKIDQTPLLAAAQ